MISNWSDAFDTTEVSNDPELLSLVVNRRLREHQYRVLGERLQENPSRGEQYLAEFTPNSATLGTVYLAGESLSSALLSAKDAALRGEDVISIPDYPLLAQMIGGFNPGRLVVIVAPTGFGKTNLVTNLAISASTKMPTCIANMEMCFEDFAKRIICIGTQTAYYDYTKIDYRTVQSLEQRISNNLFFTDGNCLSVYQLEGIVRAKKPKLLFIDYDQKLTMPYDRNTPEWQQMQRAFIQIENLAKEFNFCAVMMGQINREEKYSASQRALYSAHTVLHFKEHDEHGHVITAEKNRHATNGTILRVNYDRLTSVVKEIGYAVSAPKPTLTKPPVRLTQPPRSAQ